MTKNLTARDFWRVHCCDALTEGQAHARNEAVRPALTEVERYAAVVEAKRLRNFWFTSQLLSQDDPGISIGVTPLLSVTSITPRFSEPVIVTDMLSLFEPPLSKATDEVGILNQFVTVQQYGGQGNAYGRDFFNTDVFLMSWLTLKHERNRTTTAAFDRGELLDKFLPFTPYLLRPYETLRVRYYYSQDAHAGSNFAFCGFRALRVLDSNSPYAQLSALADRQVRNYIKGSSPETFFLEVKTTLASLGARETGTVEVRTPQQDRPLLILGATSNVRGCQARIIDEGGYYQFTYQDKPNDHGFSAILSPHTWYTEPPLSIIAPDTDFRNVNLFNMWPVPHVLEPGASLRILLKNGTIPDEQQPAATRSSQDVRITFLCRTP